MRVWNLSAPLFALMLSAGCDAAPKGGAPAAGGSAASGKPATVAAAASTTEAKPEAKADAKADSKTDVKLVLKSYDDLQALIASKKGKVVIVDAWSTYCPPCMEAFPGLVALHKKYGADKLACISLCTNYSGLGKPEDEIEGPLEFLKQQGATFDNLLSTDADEALYKKLKIPSVPSIFVYDQDGKNVKTFTTETKYSVVEEIVKPLLK